MEAAPSTEEAMQGPVELGKGVGQRREELLHISRVVDDSRIFFRSLTVQGPVTRPGEGKAALLSTAVHLRALTPSLTLRPTVVPNSSNRTSGLAGQHDEAP